MVQRAWFNNLQKGRYPPSGRIHHSSAEPAAILVSLLTDVLNTLSAFGNFENAATNPPAMWQIGVYRSPFRGVLGVAAPGVSYIQFCISSFWKGTRGLHAYQFFLSWLYRRRADKAKSQCSYYGWDGEPMMK